MIRITPAERSERLGRSAAAMRDIRADCLVLLPGPNFYYFTGLMHARERHRLFVALVRADGSLDLVGARFEEAQLAACPVPARLHPFDDEREEDQYALLARIISSGCGAHPRVGLEATVPYHFVLALAEALPGAQLVDSRAATDRLRALKSPAEIACLREAAGRTMARMAGVPEVLKEGMSERELAAAFGPSAMVQIGRTTSLPNENGRDGRLRPGDAIVIDAGDRVEGYRSDVTRAFFFGRPSPRMREIHGIVREAEAAAIDAARPGARAEEVDLAARRVIERAGYGAFFTHRGGHGIGLEFHEEPICARGNTQPLLPGMVLTAEPGVYLPGEFGVRLEDDILVTEDGCEVISGPLPEPL
ncbi:MAG: Xaa-Pro peptidase family protein [Proteobacteria bacterium]|jgi:Xaa-Pro dipeptidase|nr:Xaa-Pro peptidase family protein [Pseudomonadota bacterium]